MFNGDHRVLIEQGLLRVSYTEQRRAANDLIFLKRSLSPPLPFASNAVTWVLFLFVLFTLCNTATARFPFSFFFSLERYRLGLTPLTVAALLTGLNRSVPVNARLLGSTTFSPLKLEDGERVGFGVGVRCSREQWG